MRKLKLEIEALEVVSFDIDAAHYAGGTVRGRVDDATIGGHTCANDGSTCAAFCVQNGNSLDPNRFGCGGGIDNSGWDWCNTGVMTCVQYAGCPGHTLQTNCWQSACNGSANCNSI